MRKQNVDFDLMLAFHHPNGRLCYTHNLRCFSTEQVGNEISSKHFKKRTLSKDLVPKAGGQKFILTLVPEWVKIKWIWGKAVTMFQPEFSGVFN